MTGPRAGASPGEGALGIIAGGGDLPRLVAEAEAEAGRPPLVIRFAGTELPWAAAYPGAEIPHEKPGRLFAALRGAGCGRVCFAGGMTRPRLNPLKFDATALKLAPKALALLGKGDDEMLRGFAQMLEAEGFRLVAAQDLLEGLVAKEGPLGRAPTEAEQADAARARAIVAALGPLDVGQGAVVAGGLCLGVEAIGGTDVLLGQVEGLPGRVRTAPGGVLYKGPKPGQDRRMDLPAIGPETLRRAHAAGLTGLCVAARGALILGRAEVAAEAKRLNLAVWAASEAPA
ncbi:LpxI family protein [Rhodovulum sp. DZ06]|uniref:LpxI family protein n=1 Tax=Rhodovulum sp. DZ06 TaxID=3425126 RepID=UPI003D33317D